MILNNKEGVVNKPISKGLAEAFEGKGGVLGGIIKAFDSAGSAAGGLTASNLPTVLSEVDMHGSHANIASPLVNNKGGGRGR